MNISKVCDLCRHIFDGGERRRWYCVRCDKYYHVCPTCSERNRIPCPHCGTSLHKKLEPNK